jgi:hypothetical protein
MPYEQWECDICGNGLHTHGQELSPERRRVWAWAAALSAAVASPVMLVVTYATARRLPPQYAAERRRIYLAAVAASAVWFVGASLLL